MQPIALLSIPVLAVSAVVLGAGLVNTLPGALPLLPLLHVLIDSTLPSLFGRPCSAVVYIESPTPYSPLLLSSLILVLDRMHQSCLI